MAIRSFTVTGWSNFWGLTPSAYQMLGIDDPVSSGDLSKMFAKAGRRALRGVIKSLITNGTGQAVAVNFYNVDGPNALTNSAAMGGLRTIDTNSAISITTQASDATYINAMIDGKINKPATYPTDLSGNGGGGHLGGASYPK